MRISIKHSTVKQGLLFKTTYVEVALEVLFSHEELQILRQQRLLDTPLLERRPATAKVDDRDDKFVLTIRKIMNGKSDRFLTANPSAAKVYQDRLLVALETLKLWIGDNAELSDDLVIEL